MTVELLKVAINTAPPDNIHQHFINSGDTVSGSIYFSVPVLTFTPPSKGPAEHGLFAVSEETQPTPGVVNASLHCTH